MVGTLYRFQQGDCIDALGRNHVRQLTIVLSPNYNLRFFRARHIVDTVNLYSSDKCPHFSGPHIFGHEGICEHTDEKRSRDENLRTEIKRRRS